MRLLTRLLSSGVVRCVFLPYFSIVIIIAKAEIVRVILLGSLVRSPPPCGCKHCRGSWELHLLRDSRGRLHRCRTLTTASSLPRQRPLPSYPFSSCHS